MEARKKSNDLRFGGVQTGGNIQNDDAFDPDDPESRNSGSGPGGRNPCSITARDRMRLNGFVSIRLGTAWSRDTVAYSLACASSDAVYAESTADRQSNTGGLSAIHGL